MISDIHEFFDHYKQCINGFHIYCGTDKISISVSPRSFAEKNYVQHILQQFITSIQPKLTKNITLEVTVNKISDIKNIKITQSSKNHFDHKDPDFDYMPEIMD